MIRQQISEIQQKLSLIRDLAKAEKFNEELAHLDSGVKVIIGANYFPLLDPFLTERMKVHTHLSNTALACVDCMLLASPRVRNPNAASLYQSFVEFATGKEPQEVDLDPVLQPLFPFVVRVHYDREHCVAGSRPIVTLSIASKAEFSVSFESISIVFNQDDSPTDDIFVMGESITIAGRGVWRVSRERELKPAISVETIKAVIVKLHGVSVKIARTFCDPLRISPDESACKFEYVLPKRFIVGAVLPVRVKLSAVEQRLDQVSVQFRSDVRAGGGWEPTDLVVSARCGDISIGKEKAILGNLEPGTAFDIDLTIRHGAPVFCRLVMSLGFSTALSGVGEFEKQITFDFVSPFTAQMRMYDSNYQELPPGVLSFEKGEEIHVEMSCTNDMEFPMTICGVNSTTARIDTVDLPVVIEPGEVFTFLGTLSEPGVADVLITYETELTGRCEYRGYSRRVEQFARRVKFDFISPATVVRHQEFETRIVIDNTAPNAELAVIMLEVQNAPGFFVNGPTKKMVTVFRGRTKEIPIRFLPLEAGSTTLPPILLADTCGKMEPKKFMVPIVVTFQ